MKEEKHILLITYYWPPSGGAGVQRWLKMLNYLSEENVKCTVITVDPSKASYPIRDETLTTEISSDIRVFITSTREPLNAYKKLTGSKESPYAGFANEAKPSKVKQFSRWIRANFFIPDARKGWNKFAYVKASELIISERFDAVITTSPPHSTQLIGLKLKRNFPIHWIADLRDPWTDIYYADLFPQTKWAKRKDLRLEKSVLENADEIITVSASIKELFLQKGTIDDAHVHVIPNGYDEKDFMGSHEASKDSSQLRIAYTGTLSEQYPIEGFLSALKSIQITTDLCFAGKISQEAADKMKEFNPQLIGYVSHSESISELLKADALLLIIPKIENNEGILTGKLFEYLGSKKPIILIGPPNGDAAKIVIACGTGRVFDYSDSEQLAAYLQEIHDCKVQNGNIHTPNEREIGTYSRRNQALRVRDLI